MFFLLLERIVCPFLEICVSNRICISFRSFLIALIATITPPYYQYKANNATCEYQDGSERTDCLFLCIRWNHCCSTWSVPAYTYFKLTFSIVRVSRSHIVLLILVGSYKSLKKWDTKPVLVVRSVYFYITHPVGLVRYIAFCIWLTGHSHVCVVDNEGNVTHPLVCIPFPFLWVLEYILTEACTVIYSR